MKRDGFTLIELLVSMVMLTIIMGIVYASIDGVVRTAEIADKVSDETRRRQFIEQSFSTHLPAIYGDKEMIRPEFQLLGSNVEGPYGPADTLTFTCTVPMRGSKALPGSMKTVSYMVSDAEPLNADAGIAASSEEDLRLELQFSEEQLDLSEAFGEGGQDKQGTKRPGGALFELDEDEFHGWTLPIRSINFLYFDGEEWQEEWDSMSTQLLPWAIRVQVNFARTPEEFQEMAAQGLDLSEEADFDMVYPIPLGMGTVAPFQPLDGFTEPPSK
ncbi:MAG: prepilin-type N-terminal cleavage/methylation domain-containing protein [Candidatus Hydrogenedentes bacterium]|nr:prepilin-type N-terminal cleavage/methylation domain-containing protein [Candidatus Hydrogenedentota bacterium]